MEVQYCPFINVVYSINTTLFLIYVWKILCAFSRIGSEVQRVFFVSGLLVELSGWCCCCCIATDDTVCCTPVHLPSP